ncbi:MAG TPA: glycosyltransferase [Candidatus Portnoybacteria bacterium]|nr:glycosyltransferase [Candidatus Portnoybacteria bacterium]
MKILEINKFNFSKGGDDKHFIDLVTLLRATGNEVAVFSMHHPNNEYSSWNKYFVSYVGNNHQVSTLKQRIKGGLRMFYSWEAKRKINQLLDNFQPDIVHLHNIYHQISPSILPEIKKRQIPIVMTLHDYNLICPNYSMDCRGISWGKMRNKSGLSFIKNRCFKNSYLKSFLAVLKFQFHKRLNIYEKNIDQYISPSQFTKNIFVKNGFPEDKISVLPHFYDPKNINEKSQIDISQKYILYVGRISNEKGAKRLEEVFKELKIKNVSLYLAGKKDENFVVEKAENIKYLGFLSQRELVGYIKNALFIVSFSRLPETFGLCALEALANGKPFIGFNSGAYGEIIENGENGYICQNENEIKEKIKKLINNEKLRNLFSQKALKRAKEFNSCQYYEKIMKEFARLSNS